MAVDSTAYFPALDKCLAGEVRLISWKAAYRALCDEDSAKENTTLERFFNDDESLRILSSALDPFATPSSESAQALATKTAPIHVSQAQAADYDLEELKNDAKWLSKEMGVEEMAALRIAILECQERPADQLLHALSNGADASAGIGNLASSTFASSAMNLTPSTSAVSAPTINFKSEEVRKGRLISVFASERAHIVKLSADLLGRGTMAREHLQGQDVRGSKHLRGSSTWIDEVTLKITESMYTPQQRAKHEQFCITCVQKIEIALQRAENNSTLRPSSITTDPSHLESYIRLQYDLIVHGLRLLLSSLYSLDGVPGALLVRAWFSALEKSNFLVSDTSLLNALDLSLPQSLMSIVSADVLKARFVISALEKAAGASDTTIASAQYISDERCVGFINNFLCSCAAGTVVVAAPAIAAWSAIASTIQDIASFQRSSRDRAVGHTDDAADQSGSSRRGSREFVSEFERLCYVLSSMEQDEGREDPARYFAGTAIDRMGVFAMIAELAPAIAAVFASASESPTTFICKNIVLDVIREILPNVVYSAEILEAVIALLSTSDGSTESRRHAIILASKVLQDSDRLRPFLLDTVLARYPYELSPMLRFVTAIAPARNPSSNSQVSSAIVQTLEQLESMTQMVGDHFVDYELEHEDENANYIVLTNALPTFHYKQDRLLDPDRMAQRALPSSEQEDGHYVLCIPADTHGVVVKESRPFVFRLNHPHSGLEYLGLLLSTFMGSSEIVAAAPGLSEGLDRFTAAEIINLISALTSAGSTEDDSIDEARHVLGRLSNSLQAGQDIVYVIAEIFEAELLAYLGQVQQDSSLVLVTACANFFSTLVKVAPERVWSILARSSLLGVTDGAVSLISVVGGNEVHVGTYNFLRSCVGLHALVLNDAIAGLVKRKTRAKKTTNRFDSPRTAIGSTSEKIIGAVLNAFQRVLLDILQELPGMRFAIPGEKCRITTGILDSFVKLLRSTYGVDVAKEPSQRLTTVLGPAGDALLSTCISRTSVNPLVTSLAKLLPDGLNIAADSTPAEIRSLVVNQTNSILDFMSLLVRVAKASTDLFRDTVSQQQSAHASFQFTEERVQSLVSNVLQSMPVFAALFAIDHAFKLELFSLLSEIVQTFGSGGSDPPSILGHMKTDAAKLFLEVATQLDRPLSDVQVERVAWDFLVSLMSSRQQWCSMYLLTGTLPKDRASLNMAAPAKKRPLLRSVLDQLSGLSVLNPDRAIGMLKFIATTQQTWAWATNEVRSHPEFLKSAITWLDGLKAPPMQPTAALARVSTKDYEMAAYMYDILAINLHASLEMGDKTVLKTLAPKLGFLKDHGTAVNAYNRPLHKSLAENLKRKFPESELSDFKRTAINPAPLGPDFLYDRQFATGVLSHDSSWHGADPGRTQGFFDEFTRANVNLSLLHAQTLLLQNLKSLVMSLCEWAHQEPSIHSELVKVAAECLRANAKPQIDQPGVARVLELRLELAFVLLSKLIALKVQSEDMKGLLSVAWDLVCISPVDYDVATAPEDFLYYRKLIQVLYLTIQPHIYTFQTGKTTLTNEDHVSYLDNGIAGCLQSIVAKLIVPSFRALCGNLHNDLSLASPEDFALLTALLQAVVSIPGISSVYHQIANIVANSSTIRGALSLFSWSDQLAEIMDQDPIYGEIAIMFLLALSTVPPVAEQMARDGALTTLSSASLSNYLRKPGGKGPFDDPPRMFVIWTEGFLPLCLNLLDAAGPAIAAEIAAFLNTFPEQLRRAQQALQNETPGPKNTNAGTITLGLIAEAHSLSMIALILDSDIARAAAEGINAADVPTLDYDLSGVKTLVEGLSRTKRSLSDRIKPASPLEARWEKTPTAGASDNLLHAKVMREILNMLSTFGSSAT